MNLEVIETYSPSPQDKAKVFQYTLFKMIEWSIELNKKKYNTFFDFSKDNNFSREKLLLIPFFVCTANGVREPMFGFFDNFYASEFGHCETDIEDQLPTLNYFKLSTPNAVGLDESFLKDHGQKNKLDREELLETLDLNVSYKENFEFEGKKFKTIFDLVDHSIDKLRERNEEFVNYDKQTLSFYSQKHKSWIIFNLISVVEKKHKIQVEMLIKEPSMYAANIDNRILA